MKNLPTMTTSEAQEILDRAKAAVEKEVHPAFAMILQALQRRIDFAELRGSRARPAPCKHGMIQNDLFLQNRPCKGRKVICLCEANPVDNVYEGICRPEKCKFYETEGK